VERVFRAVAFIVFFSVGTAVVSATVLCDDLQEYFHNKALLKQANDHLKKLESLNSDYDTLLIQVEGDPRQLSRLAPATLGIEPNDPCTAYPHASADKLAAAKRALSEEPNVAAEEDLTPKWLNLFCCWPRRHILFISGATLILISFVFFGPTRRPSHTVTVTSHDEQPLEDESEPAQNPENGPPTSE
jgi:hypothetical protein